MTQKQQLKLQAFLDGELPEREAREILAWTQRDGAAAALLQELRNTRQAMANSEPHLSLPESREFFWSKIEHEIQRLEPSAAAPSPSIFVALRRWLLPAVAVATLVIAGLIARFHAPPAGVTVVADADAPDVETTLANSDATTYRDASEGTTLVLFSYADDTRAPNKKPTAIN
jgi:anti-sigma factor RsiW